MGVRDEMGSSFKSERAVGYNTPGQGRKLLCLHRKTEHLQFINGRFHIPKELVINIIGQSRLSGRAAHGLETYM